MAMSFSSSELPTGANLITRKEELAAWLATQVQPQIGTLTDVLAIGQTPTPVTRQQVFTNFQGDSRLEVLIYLQLAPDWATNGKPIWKSVNPYQVS